MRIVVSSILTLTIFCVNLSAVPAPVEVDEVRGNKIFFVDGRVIEVNGKTEFVEKTKDGEVKAKIGDVKAGNLIEVQTEVGTNVTKKIVIHEAAAKK
jgi:hypothetical protein